MEKHTDSGEGCTERGKSNKGFLARKCTLEVQSKSLGSFLSLVRLIEGIQYVPRQSIDETQKGRKSKVNACMHVAYCHMLYFSMHVNTT
jgi:hypothetical protein